jgi:adenylate cyclase
MTTLVEQLFDRYGVAAVGFDVVFAEPDTSSGLDSLRRLAQRDLAGSRDFQAALEQLAPRLDYDARFAGALTERPVSLGYYFIRRLRRPHRHAAAAVAAARFSRCDPAHASVSWREPGGIQRAAQAGLFNMQAVDARRQMNLVSPRQGFYLPCRFPCGWRSAAILLSRGRPTGRAGRQYCRRGWMWAAFACR